MDELSLFRNFRRDVAAPSDDTRQRASARLASAIEGQHRPGTTLLRPVRRRPGRTTLAFAAVVGAAAAALFVSTPWTSSPGLLEPAQAARFLERAEAALTQPAGTILHFEAELSRTSRKFGCTTTSPNEMWIDQASPHGWRSISGVQLHDPARAQAADERTIACSDWGTHEVGGDTLGGNDAAGKPVFVRQLMFVPPNTLRASPVAFAMTHPDPIAFIRDVIRAALDSGRGHDEGMTELNGRAVRRFRLDCPRPDPRLVLPCAGPEYLYMDPETFLPVQLEQPGAATYADRNRVLRFDIVSRYRAIEYLPRTEENLALTDIRAQHPDATVVRQNTTAPGKRASAAPAASAPQSAAGKLGFQVTARQSGPFDWPCPVVSPQETMCIEYTGKGSVRGLGKVSMTYNWLLGVGPPACPANLARPLAKPLATKGRVSVAEKGTINFRLSAGARCVAFNDGPSVWLYEPQKFTIIGGTGRFAAASGMGSKRRTVVPGGLFPQPWTGTLEVGGSR